MLIKLEWYQVANYPMECRSIYSMSEMMITVKAFE